MKNKLTLLLLIVALSGSTAVAQRARDKARANIVLLKSGALFVRLKTSELKINALKQIGKEKEAEEMRIEQENKNKSIIAAFKKNFTFCPVYFFYSNHSTQIKEGNYKGLIFDTALNTDVKFTGTNYLIGEYDESQTTQIDAFFIKDKNYEQLRSPFPFLIKLNQMLVSTRSDDAIVALLNEKLFEYYSN